jgi:hypothetical protein
MFNRNRPWPQLLSFMAMTFMVFYGNYGAVFYVRFRSYLLTYLLTELSPS